MIETKFFILNRDKLISEIYQGCELCQSLAQIPKEIESFKPNKVPDHPGMSFTVDVLRYSKKLAVVATDNFSGFVSTSFIKSETNEQLLEGIILTVLPFKTTSMSKIRVDQAPGFKKLDKRKADLEELGIELELGEAKNKNALSLVDRKMQELQAELRKIAPSNNVINIKLLAHATSIVNERVRSSGFSAKEILFSRDQFSQENLLLEDKQLAQDKMDKREKDNTYSAKSKATVNKPSKPANAKHGQLVFLKRDGDKLSRRELYLVLKVDETEQALHICKLLNTISDSVATLQPHNITYKVKQSDVFLAPNQPIETTSELLSPPSAPPRQISPTLPDQYSYYPQHLQEYSPTPKRIYQPCTDDTDDEDDDDWWQVEEHPQDQTEDEQEVIEQDGQDQIHEEVELEIDQTQFPIEQVPADEELSAAESAEDNEEDTTREEEVVTEGSAEVSEEEDPADNVQNLGELPAFHPDWGNLNDLSANPPLPPIDGSLIEYYHELTRSTKKAKIETTFKTVQAKHPGWFNITNEGFSIKTSVNLSITRWKYFTTSSPSEDDEEIYQVDGNYTLFLNPGSINNSLDWDEYAPEPSYSLPSTGSLTPETSERAMRRSHREESKSSQAGEINSSSSYNFRPRRQLSFFDVDDLHVSSDDTDSDVFELQQEEQAPPLLHPRYQRQDPPPLPPKPQRSSSVIVCSKQTCKPSGISHPQ